MSAVQPGYKMTEVGVIPEDWYTYPIRSLASYMKGFAFKSTEYRESGIRVLRVSDFSQGYVKADDAVYLNVESSQKYSQWLLQANDVIISTVGSKPPMLKSLVGSSILIEESMLPLLLNQNAVKLTFNSKSRAQLVFCHLKTSRYISFIAEIYRGNANQASITLLDLFQFPIPLPPTKAEQEAIAEALSDADALIESIEQVIAKKRLIKQGAMQELLTGKRRLPGFGEGVGYRQTEVGVIPEDWGVEALSKITTIIMGQSPPSHSYNSKNQGLPLIQGNADIKNREAYGRIHTSLPTKKAVSGDTILTVRAPVGEVSKAIRDVCLGRGVCALKFPNNYMFHIMIFNERKWGQYSKGSTFDSITSSDVASFEIPLPPTKAEQEAIAQVLTDMDDELDALQEQLDKARQIKQGMMHELLTGRIRLV